MKVIKSGKVEKPENWKAKVTCKKKDELDSTGCGAVLTVTAKDLVMMYWHGTHSCHYYTAVKCPQCGKYNRAKIPDSVWKEFNTATNRKKAIFDGFDESI